MNNINYHHYFAEYSVLILVLFLIIKCSENEITSNNISLNLPFFKKAVVPDTLHTGTSENLLIMLETEKSIYNNIGYILIKIFDSSYNLIHSPDTLYDNAYFGDVVSGDGIFSRLINSSSINFNPGEYFIEFSNPDVDEILIDTIHFIYGEKNLPPVLSNLIMPDTVSLDNEDIKYYIFLDVIDPQGRNDIKEVKGKVYYPYFPVPSLDIFLKHEGIPSDILRGENNFVYIFQPNDIAKRGAGEYSILFFAEDKEGNRSSTSHGTIYFHSENENLPPVIEYVNLPDTVSSSAGTILIEAKVTDINGRGDIQKVYFNSFLPDGKPSTGNPFYMFDDGSELSLEGGVSGDRIKDDGIYSRRVIVPPTAEGNYLFIFYAVDKVQNISVPVEHYLIVK
ncbi:hypothetical protein ACFL4Z_01860 [candidate division KSB1 bacterium]